MSLELIRHGETTHPGRYLGSTDVALSEAGLARMWHAVHGRRWDRILSSPLRRCAAFAAPLAQSLAVPLGLDARLREMHFGDWEGCSVAELQQRCPDALGAFWRDPERYPPPGAEPVAALRRRVFEAVAEFSARHLGERLLLVTHGGPIRVLLATARAGGPLTIEVPLARLIPLPACVPC